MRTQLQRIGNSQGIIIPKPLLAQLGFERDLDIDVENDTLVVRKPANPREGWAEAARAIAEAREPLVLGDFANAGDDEWEW